MGDTATLQGRHCHITGGSVPHYKGVTATLQGGHCHITGGGAAALQGGHCHVTGGSLPHYRGITATWCYRGLVAGPHTIVTHLLYVAAPPRIVPESRRGPQGGWGGRWKRAGVSREAVEGVRPS